ncbi:MAG TPA: glycoside hydrolase family 9 protein [Puia sp.]|nr:glycoside hydrolase family 9 protein [Puia sp.]
MTTAWKYKTGFLRFTGSSRFTRSFLFTGSFLFAGLLTICIFSPVLIFGQKVRVITNHVGYEYNGVKRAMLIADGPATPGDFQLIDDATGKVEFTGKPVYSGPVKKWKSWIFWTIDFSAFTGTGTYRIQLTQPATTAASSSTASGLSAMHPAAGHTAHTPQARTAQAPAATSYPFLIGKNILEQSTLSDLIYYFKGQRSSGLLDQADHHLHPSGKPGSPEVHDLHGGWYDATGDYGKHLSHLSFSSYFNPQQVSLTAWTLLKTYELLNKRQGTDFRQYKRRLLDEAMYGADYLTRCRAENGSFYRSVGAPGPGKLARDRVLQAETQSYRIKQSKDQSFTAADTGGNWRSYQASFRSGGGMAIAALAIAATYDTSGDYSNKDYLRAAEEAFVFLDKENALMTNDGKENIVDDYCALSAATELYKATHKAVYAQAAEKRAGLLLGRFAAWKKYKDYWRADDKDRPFFHPSDAGLPLVSLIYYYPYAAPATQQSIKEAVRRSFRYELSLTHEVNNPFGYSRQLVQDTSGHRHSAFFFPHGSEASPWWQGENARLGSMAAAARLAANLLNDDAPLRDSLRSFALDQLNWVLGLNPFDACMLQGTGHNNPAYGFFGTFEYTNAPGGIVNGITSGLEDEEGIDFNLSYAQTKKDYDWRWAEQWLPHAAWYLLAISVD